MLATQSGPGSSTRNGIDALLSRLERVRRVGQGKWVARCPAHDDRGPSLSIAETSEGRILLHDFGAQCSADAILGAVGLDWTALFPERDPDDVGRSKGWRSASVRDSRQRTESIPPRVALVAIHADAVEAAVIVADVAEGRCTAESARAKLWTLAGRIASALNLSGCARG